MARAGMLAGGTMAIGVGLALLLRAGLGVVPIDVLHLGVTHALGVSLGGGIIATQAVLLMLCVPLHVPVGIGTVAGFLVPAVVVDVVLAWLAPPVGALLQIGFLLAGGALMCAGAAVYLTAAMGTMPRDGLMLALGGGRTRRTATVRIGIDLACVVIGTVLAGGPVPAWNAGALGPGTVLLVVASGPAVAWAMARLRPLLPPGRSTPTPPRAP